VLNAVFLAVAALGAYCAVKPDNPLLPYLDYYNAGAGKPAKVSWKGGLAAEHIKKFGKTRGLLVWMRLFGLGFLLVGAFFLAKSLGLA